MTTTTLNRDDAFEAMLQGKIVRGINGVYLTHVEHGGKYLYRWNPIANYIERLEFGRWRKSVGSFDLISTFEIVDGPLMGDTTTHDPSDCPEHWAEIERIHQECLAELRAEIKEVGLWGNYDGSDCPTFCRNGCILGDRCPHRRGDESVDGESSDE